MICFGTHTRSLIIACGMTFLLYLGAFMRAPIVPIYATQLGASVAEVGLINAAFMAVACILAIPLGLFSDRFGRKSLILLGSSLSAAVSFLFFFARNPYQMMGIYAIGGLGVASFTPTMISFIGDISPPASLGKAYGLFSTSMQVGIASGPALGGYVAKLSGYGETFLLSAAIISLAVAAGFSSFPSTLPPRMPLKGLKLRAEFRTLRTNREVLACWVGIFSLYFTWGASSAFLPLYAHDLGLSIFAIGLLFTIQSGGNALARFPFGALSDKLGRRQPFLIFGMVLGSIATGFIPFIRSPYTLGGVAFFLGIGVGITGMSASALIAEAAPIESRGFAVGVYSTCFYAGMALSPAILGQVIEAYGFHMGFSLAAFVGLSGMVLVRSLLYRRGLELVKG